MEKTTLVWLQRELRLSHLPALQDAIAQSDKVALVYFHDPQRTLGQANSVWLAHSLLRLQASLRHKGAELLLYSGDFAQQFALALQEIEPQQVFYSVQVGQPFTEMQNLALQMCKKRQVALQPFYSEFWFTPGEVVNKQGNPYVVFTPFYKAVVDKLPALQPLDERVVTRDEDWLKLHWPQLPAERFELPLSLREIQNRPWAQKLLQYWQPGEDAAWQQLQRFITQNLSDYDHDRDFPLLDATSRLSAYLHFGEISAQAIYFELIAYAEENPQLNAQPWLRQLLWREFARLMLWFFPNTETEPFQQKFADMRWQDNAESLSAWQSGQTGIPIIDAGMRELWETGYMHNRVRMLVASLLTKDLNVNWRHGQAWFANTLLDADPANNAMGWQWVAGCGVDAAPYYRLFNPLRQSEKFDAQGDYIRKWVPELRTLSSKAIHAPWLYPQECVLKGINLGKHYPYPVVDLKRSRAQHLLRVDKLKRGGKRA
ncbi:cryptochrome/photolyase family protein [Thiomicrorhabdus xiamenensis]|uniref:Deoxyribodipyrimidine photo-lyase n=1 Tax=Thiomicrorhabdus xiamenensis TaxID=2739063 RepID=A0A7D4TF24_9GAMM|nr:deoxyribodipyrimidine photo-lyase [Thiomicrorhabdus xiamenensis]QKI88488.1 deoxyribodipyrimidine photo-lyase [Thiomicrorhabdus xiamenensis]